MEKVKHYWHWFIREKQYFTALFILVMLILFILNSLHESYPDEFDNILGGWYILHGRLIYTGFFTHHGPTAYFLAAIVEIFSGRSFVRFRIVYSIFLLAYFLWTYYFLKTRTGIIKLRPYLYFIPVIGIAATYFWGQMLLADTISGFFLIPVYVLLFLKIVYRENLVKKDFIFISVLTALAQLSSLTYTYLIFFITLCSIGYYFYFQPTRAIKKRTILEVLGIFLAPYLVFFVYLLITGSLSDYIYQAITFNEKYYIYNYPRPPGSSHINPIRYAIVIAHNILGEFFTLAIQIKDFNLTYPFNVTILLANIVLLIYLLSKRNYYFAVFLVLFLIYSNARSDPLTSKETDYQSAVYILISLFNLCWAIPSLYKELNAQLVSSKRVIFVGCFALLSIYSLFTGFFLFDSWMNKVYAKYMGTAPLIYDRPIVAPVINSIVTPNDYMWIGPFSFQELFYADGNIPSQYHILIPDMGQSQQIQDKLISDFNTHKPKVIYFDKRFFVLGKSPETYGQFFLNFLNANYVTLLNYHDGNTKYVSVAPVTLQLDLEQYLFINKNDAKEVVAQLMKNNYIKPVTVASEKTSSPSKKSNTNSKK
ncbi:MAG TPA: hypothetical protein VLF89_08565 [Candidatus Saccharimonadales bacterium]|nr:hypothetical protein [Candidatus Saccharimonadales bacterium]